MTDGPIKFKNEILWLVLKGLRKLHCCKQPRTPRSSSNVNRLGKVLFRGLRAVTPKSPLAHSKCPASFHSSKVLQKIAFFLRLSLILRSDPWLDWQPFCWHLSFTVHAQLNRWLSLRLTMNVESTFWLWQIMLTTWTSSCTIPFMKFVRRLSNLLLIVVY